MQTRLGFGDPQQSAPAPPSTPRPPTGLPSPAWIAILTVAILVATGLGFAVGRASVNVPAPAPPPTLVCPPPTMTTTLDPLVPNAPGDAHEHEIQPPAQPTGAQPGEVLDPWASH